MIHQREKEHADEKIIKQRHQKTPWNCSIETKTLQITRERNILEWVNWMCEWMNEGELNEWIFNHCTFDCVWLAWKMNEGQCIHKQTGLWIANKNNDDKGTNDIQCMYAWVWEGERKEERGDRKHTGHTAQ